MRLKTTDLLSRFALSVVLLTCTSPAWSDVLDTATVSNNGTGGIFTQVAAIGGSNLFIESFTTQLGNTTVGTQADVQVWTRPGAYAGFTASNAGWTLQETIIGFSAGIAVNTPLSPLATPILVEQGAGVSIYLHSITVGNGIRYFGTGTTSTSNYNDANLALFTNPVATIHSARAFRAKFGMRSLLVAVLLVAVSFACYMPYLKSQRLRQARLQQFELVENPNVIGKPIGAFPKIPVLANDVIDESHPDARQHLESLVHNRTLILKMLNSSELPMSGLKIYIFKFEEPIQEGEPNEFAVITHNSVIVFVHGNPATW